MKIKNIWNHHLGLLGAVPRFRSQFHLSAFDAFLELPHLHGTIPRRGDRFDVRWREAAEVQSALVAKCNGDVVCCHFGATLFPQKPCGNPKITHEIRGEMKGLPKFRYQIHPHTNLCYNPNNPHQLFSFLMWSGYEPMDVPQVKSQFQGFTPDVSTHLENRQNVSAESKNCPPFFLRKWKSTYSSTPITKIAPEKWWLEDDISFWNGPHVSFQGYTKLSKLKFLRALLKNGRSSKPGKP